MKASTRDRSRAKWLAAILTLGLIAAACGDDDDDKATGSTAAGTDVSTGTPATTGASTATSGASNTTAASGSASAFAGVAKMENVASAAEPTTQTRDGVSDTEIHVSGLWTAAFYAGSDVGVKARFKRANDAGGVNGRKLIFDEMLDDGGEQSKNLDNAKKLVQQKNTFAVLPAMTAALGGADYLKEQKVPFFGWAIQPVWTNNEYGFGWSGSGQEGPTAGSITNELYGQLFADKTAKGHKFAFIGEDNDSAKVGSRDFETIFSQDGANVVYNKNTVPTPPAVVNDYSPFAQDIIAAEPEVTILVVSFNNALKLAQALQAANYKGTIAAFVSYDPRLASAMKDVVSILSFAPWETKGNAIVDQMTADVKALDPETLLGQPVAAGYFAADMFISILEKTGKDVTREKFVQAANTGLTWELKGVAGPTSYPDFHINAIPCGALVKSNGTTFDVVAPYTCGKFVPNPSFKGLK